MAKILCLTALGALAPRLPAQTVIAGLFSEEGCVTSPEDGVFCDEDPGVFEIFDHVISGEVTEHWDAQLYTEAYHVGAVFHNVMLNEGSRLTIHGGFESSAHPWMWVAGTGALRIASGYVAFEGSGQVNRGHTTGYAYSGGLEVAGSSVLSVYSADGLGSGPLSLTDSASLYLYNASGQFSTLRGFSVTGNDAQLVVVSAPTEITGVVSGDGRLNLSGAVTLSADNTHTGGTRLLSGELTIAKDAALGAADTALILDGGTKLNLSAGFASSTRTLALGGTVSIAVNATDPVTWHGATSGSGQLVKRGTGTLVLAGGIDHTGGAQLDAGTLDVSVSATLGGTGSTTWSGAITGTGQWVKSGAGTLVLAGPDTHTGYTTVRGGTLRTDAANVLSAGSALFLIHGGTLDLAGHDQTVGDLDSWDFTASATSPGTVQLGGATLTNLNRVTNNWAGALTGSGTFIKQGAAAMHWSGANTFTGTLQIAAGTLHAQAANVLSAGAIVQIDAGASLRLNDHAQTIAGLSGSGTASLGSAALTTDQATHTTFSGVITGTGSLAKLGAGTLTLSGDNTYTGTTTIAAGALFVNGSLANTAVTVQSGATLSGTGTIGGLTTIASGAHLAPGNSPGTLTFTHGLTLSDGAILDFQLGDAFGEAGIASDLIVVSGGTLTGSDSANGVTLNLTDAGGFGAGTYDLIRYTGATTDSFDLTDFHPVSALTGYDFTLGFSGSILQLTVSATAVPEPSTWAALAGAGALAFAFWRRRRKP